MAPEMKWHIKRSATANAVPQQMPYITLLAENARNADNMPRS